MQEVKINKKYKHFKGNIYEVIGVGIHSEDNSEYVIYKTTSGEEKIYIRPKDMFCSEVDHKKYPNVKQKYRFELVKDLSEENIMKSVESFLDPYRQYNVDTGETIYPYEYNGGVKYILESEFHSIQDLYDLTIQKCNLLEEKNKGINSLMDSKNKWKTRYEKDHQKIKDYKKHIRELEEKIIKQKCQIDGLRDKWHTDPWLLDDYVKKDKINKLIEDYKHSSLMQDSTFLGFLKRIGDEIK